MFGCLQKVPIQTMLYIARASKCSTKPLCIKLFNFYSDTFDITLHLIDIQRRLLQTTCTNEFVPFEKNELCSCVFNMVVIQIQREES